MAPQAATLKRPLSSTSTSIPSHLARRPRIESTPTPNETATVVPLTASHSRSPTLVNSPSPPPIFTQRPLTAHSQPASDSDSSSVSSESESASEDGNEDSDSSSEDGAAFHRRQDRDRDIVRQLNEFFPESRYSEENSSNDSDSQSSSEESASEDSHSEPESTSSSSSEEDSEDSSSDSDSESKTLALDGNSLLLRAMAAAPNADSDTESDTDETPSPALPSTVDTATASNIHSRLATFLPAMKEANDVLEREREAGTLAERGIENIKDEEGKYIEMDLGLGVLEERGGSGFESDGSETEDDYDACEIPDVDKIPVRRPRLSGRKGALDQLMGTPKVGAKPAIEVL